MAVQDPAWGDRSTMRYVNRDVPRVDGPAKVTGRAKYPHDQRLERMVYARFLCCHVPAAKVEEIDVAPALGVPRVIDAMVVEDERTSYLGQPVAVVAAETPEAAEDGVRAIRARFSDEAGWVVTREQALADGAPEVKRGGNAQRPFEREEGEVDAAFEKAAAVVEATYVVPVQNHACLETHGVVVDYRGGDSVTVYASTQGTFTAHEQAAGEFGEGVDVVCDVQYMGGGFGGKFSIGIEGKTACQLAKKLERPVHLFLPRAHEFVTSGNRSGNHATFRAAGARDGRLLALVSDADKLGGIADGSYARQPYIYSPESYRTRSRSVHTNTDGNRAMRAPGHPQASFGIESILDELAYALGVDPLAIRKRNLANETYHRQLDVVAREVGWAEHPHKAKPGPATGDEAIGIGFGVSTWGGGGRPGCQVDVTIARDGAVDVSVGTQDLGTGTRTYVRSIVAEELGLPLDAVREHIGNSRLGNANASGGSVTVASLAPAVKDAAHKARVALLERVGSAANVSEASLRLRESRVEDPENGFAMSWKQACATLGAEGVAVRGTWQPGLSSTDVQGAQAAKVAVDLLTGAVRVVKMVCIQNVGLPLNRLATRSQINGGMIQALSYALLENTLIDPDLGLCLNPNFEEYKLAASLEMPEMVALIDDEDERGVIGVGEPPAIPGAGAIANAVHNACGVRVRELPITPDKVLVELERLRNGGGR